MAARELSILTDDGVVLAGEGAGEESSPAIVLLHGLTATRRYVVMGSRLLERSGYRVIAYDARGHGRSTPPVLTGGQAAGEAEYGYARLARDLEAVLDALELGRAALAGASMGAHTILRFALDHPERVAAMGLVTPAFDPAANADGPDTSTALDGSHRPAGAVVTPEGDRDAARPGTARGRGGGVRARLRLLHGAPRVAGDRGAGRFAAAVAARAPRRRRRRDGSRFPLAAVRGLRRARRDRRAHRRSSPRVTRSIPGIPLALAERYADAIPGATLTVEDGGPPLRSPIAWQGGSSRRCSWSCLPGPKWSDPRPGCHRGMPRPCPSGGVRPSGRVRYT